MDQLHRGKDTKEITNALLDLFKELQSDEQEHQNFWCALADVQWRMGRLLPDVKANAMSSLNPKEFLLDWQFSSAKNKQSREKILQELRERLSSPQPEEKKVSTYRLFHCPWKPGDVFLLPLGDGVRPEARLWDHSLLIEMICTRTWHPGHEIPVVYLKLTHNDSIPKTREEYEKLDYLKTDEIRAGRILPASDNEPEMVRNMRNCVDERGLLNVFRIALITKSKHSIPKDLQYIGNFQGLEHPNKEYIPYWEESIRSLFWKELAEKVADYVIRYRIRK